MEKKEQLLIKDIKITTNMKNIRAIIYRKF